MRLRQRATCGRTATGRTGAAAFTFAEVLAALVFMAIVVPVAMHGLQIASRAGAVAERKGVATRLADQILNDLVVSGNWRTAGTSPRLGLEWKDYEKDYQYRTFNEAWSEDSMMRLISVEVYYQVQSKDFQVRLSTLMCNTNS